MRFLLLSFLSLSLNSDGKRRKSNCDAIKPVQQLTAERDTDVSAAIAATMRGLGSGGGEAARTTQSTYEVRLLANDALARSWYTYQLCVLRTDGTISSAMYEEFMRVAWGAGGTPSVQSSPVSESEPIPGSPPSAGFTQSPPPVPEPRLMASSTASATPPSEMPAASDNRNIDSTISIPPPTPATSVSALDELRSVVTSPEFETKLAGPDGAAISLSDPDNWKVYAMGTASIFSNDAYSTQVATTEAMLVAKAELARFFSEQLSTTSQVETLSDTFIQSGGTEPSVVRRETVKRQLMTIQSSADMILRGVVVLESSREWNGTSGLVRVKVGQSQKTLAAANRLMQLSTPGNETLSTSGTDF